MTRNPYCAYQGAKRKTSVGNQVTRFHCYNRSCEIFLKPPHWRLLSKKGLRLIIRGRCARLGEGTAMRVAVTGRPIPACGGSRWLPRSLAQTGWPPSSDLVPSKQQAPVARRSLTARESRLPLCVFGANDRVRASARRNSRDTAGMPSIRLGAALFISGRCPIHFKPKTSRNFRYASGVAHPGILSERNGRVS